MRGARRRWLAGAGLALALGRLRRALAVGAAPQGVARVRGEVRVNGAIADRGTVLEPGDVVTTGRGAELVAAIGRDAFLVRGAARVEFEGRAAERLVTGLRVATGAVLSVFDRGRPRTIRTPTASIGIRGSGVYVEAEADRTYVCTCYGTADLVPLDDPQAAETVRTTHHEQPRYIHRKGVPRMIERAPFVNHTDAELTLLESLVGRVPPFAGKY